MGDTKLSDQFPQIFSITNVREALITDIVQTGHGILNWDLQLRHGRYEWEEQQFNQLMLLLDGVQFEEGVDMWRWKSDKNGVFTVKSLYAKLVHERTIQNLTVGHQFHINSSGVLIFHSKFSFSFGQ
ncbi:hypothetical protein FRX31_004178 [Thalictrum thalictroides]|uniref:Uncharacterized protein n=1 Tax=Thalictrum thalictroides TaxID=46969 RepID=A0A7J6XCX9_THATH|nr:hypothetical protein FRX31_004178 [Thalictrum thalictroides]